MKSKEEIKKWILENCTNELGIIDLQDLDFEDNTLDFRGIKAKSIWNDKQEGNEIYNNGQKAEFNIYNREQKSNKIYT